MSLEPFSVYYFYHGPSKHDKYFVVVSDIPDNFCLFINTKPYHNDVFLPKHQNNYLKYDSFVGCNKVIQEDITVKTKNGERSIGRIHRDQQILIIANIQSSRSITPYEKKTIFNFYNSEPF